MREPASARKTDRFPVFIAELQLAVGAAQGIALMVGAACKRPVTDQHPRRQHAALTHEAARAAPHPSQARWSYCQARLRRSLARALPSRTRSSRRRLSVALGKTSAGRRASRESLDEPLKSGRASAAGVLSWDICGFSTSWVAPNVRTCRQVAHLPAHWPPFTGCVRGLRQQGCPARRLMAAGRDADPSGVTAP